MTNPSPPANVGQQPGADVIMKLLQSGYSMDMIQSLIKSGGTQKALVGSLGGQVAALPGIRVSPTGQRSNPTYDAKNNISSKISGILKPATQAIGKAAPVKNTTAASNVLSKIQGILGTSNNAAKGEKTGILNNDFQLTDSSPSAAQQAYTAPVFSMKDFTDEANRIAKDAYGPQYQALDLGRQNAQNQYNTSDQVVAGLYQKLAEKLGASGEQQAQQYDQSSADAAARTAALEKQIANTYGGSQQQEADLMQKIGGQQAAAQTLPDNSAFQQSEAAVQGNDQANYYAQQKQAANDQTTGTQNAATTQGAVSRESLVKDLANVLNQYDQQQLQVAGNQSTTALDIANQLSNRDMQMQQLNAGAQTDAWNANNTLAQQQQQAAQYADTTAYNRGQDAQQNQLAQNKFQVDSANAASQLQIDRGKLQLDQQAASPGVDPKSLPVATQIVSQGEMLAPGQGQKMYDFIAAWTQAHGNVMGDLDPVGFSQQVAADAAAQGLNGSAVAAVAGSFYKQMLGR